MDSFNPNSHAWRHQDLPRDDEDLVQSSSQPYASRYSANVPDRGHRHVQSLTSNPSQHPNYRPIQPQSNFMPSTSFGPAPVSHTYQRDNNLVDLSHQDYNFNDLMTPEYSDNYISEQTTPQELIWQEQFITPNTAESQITESSSQAVNAQEPEVSTSRPPTESRNVQQNPRYVSGAQLLSPQLSSPSPPPPASHHQHGHHLVTPGMPQPSTHDNDTAVATSASLQPLTTEALNQSQRPLRQASVSPVVIISSHNRGDSPARTTFPRARSPSKRSRGSSLYETAAAEARSADIQRVTSSNDDSNSRLMPPDPFDSEFYSAEPEERLGQGPNQRTNEQIMSINELADHRQMSEKNADVEDWLAKSETGSAAGDDARDRPSRSSRRRNDRPRAHSAAARADATGIPVYSDKHIPGPGVLIEENSNDEFSEDDAASLASTETSNNVPGSPPVLESKLHQMDSGTNEFPTFEDDEVPPELQEPLPRQFYRRGPWQDPIRGPPVSSQDQPNSSSAAAWRFNQEAAKWESASRAATWGTRRRLSEGEVSAIVDGSKVRHLSLAKRGRERGSTLLNKARGLIPKRSNSNIKKGAQLPSDETSRPEAPAHRESTSSIKPVQRITSFGKPKSPALNTGSAIMAMTGNLAAIGHSGSFTTEPEQKSEGLRSPLQLMRKVRSKSDVTKAANASPGLADLMRGYGGPPMPTLASPMQERPDFIKSETLNDATFDDDDDELIDEAGIKMDLSIRAEHIIPTYEGFKNHARQLNPRLELYLIDRIGQEQIRRYKKLVETKIKHIRAVTVQKKCSSGPHCFALGGAGTILPPRTSAKDPDTVCAQFQVTNSIEGEIDESSFEEGVVTPALFPPGIPLPPVQRLPAEFECILCFKVKKFQKPSDWTKHVHEDIQPFSCTFPNCNEPKSFKRKADWVRHENERHRRLEYWKCNVQECNHICYRKDNFVQHLVREHKKTEPKVKSRGSGSSKARPNSQTAWQQEQDDEVWQLVDSCRHETLNKPRDEPCKFCGNVCSSWKKLSVHMGKHMEQLAMPVLELVDMKEVAPDTIISPIEQNYGQSNVTIGAPAMLGSVDHPALSPYALSAHSTYHSSSAGQSPAGLQVHPQMANSYDPGYYSNGMNTPMQGQMSHAEAMSSIQSTSAPYLTHGGSSGGHFASINTQLGSYPSMVQTPGSAHTMQSGFPRSEAGYGYNSDQAQYQQNSMNSYQHYTPTSAAGPFASDPAPQQNMGQNYNLESHATQGMYDYNEQHMNGSNNAQYLHYN